MDLGRTTPANLASTSVDVPLDVLSRLTHEGLAFVDQSGRIAVWNDAAASVCGLSTKRVLGAAFSEIFENGEGLLKGTTPEAHQLRLVPRDTADRSIGAAAVRLASGWLISFGPQRQFTAIEQMKSEIISAVSHELKTPIATIKAYATTLREHPDRIASETDEYLKTIEQQADRLTHAVDDLLVAARVDVAHLLKQRVRIALDTLLDEIICALSSEHARRITRATAGIEVSGDPDLLREAFTHLIENALKFSPANTPIHIDAEKDALLTTIRIHDEGVGIDEDHLPYIFERFYRVDSNLTATTSGSGLGLYVARAVVRAHGGTIAVESKSGSGSTFIVTLPVRP